VNLGSAIRNANSSLINSPGLSARTQAQLRSVVALYARGQRRCLLEQGLPQHAGLLPMLRKLSPVSQSEFLRAAGFDKSWASRVLRSVAEGLVERVVQTGASQGTR
jgi:hypothetical protein